MRYIRMCRGTRRINRVIPSDAPRTLYGLLRFARFLFDRYGQSTQLLPFRPVNEVFAASGPDGFSRVFIPIGLEGPGAERILRKHRFDLFAIVLKMLRNGGVTVQSLVML
jgi:hypothetical protein